MVCWPSCIRGPIQSATVEQMQSYPAIVAALRRPAGRPRPAEPISIVSSTAESRQHVAPHVWDEYRAELEKEREELAPTLSPRLRPSVPKRSNRLAGF